MSVSTHAPAHRLGPTEAVTSFKEAVLFAVELSTHRLFHRRGAPGGGVHLGVASSAVVFPSVCVLHCLL